MLRTIESGLKIEASPDELLDIAKLPDLPGS